MQYLRAWKQEKGIIFENFSIYEQIKFHAQLSWAWIFYTLMGLIWLELLSYLNFSF